MAEEKKGFFKEFKEFISKGNIVDMAVGVIIGGAFGKIVTSLVSDIITPLISLALGKANFSQLFALLQEAPAGVDVKTIEQAQELGLATLNYGAFIQTIIDFIIVALCIFFVLKAIMKAKALAEKAKKKEEEAPAPEPEPEPEPEPSEEVLLLREIRDALKEKQE
ncbi:MAG: large conductance mechanosensitive channel protein MscL [Clostridia bacterium]|nr:large conductance mechanosensitive channel protein MscL [Clostridia bacterium]